MNIVRCSETYAVQIYEQRTKIMNKSFLVAMSEGVHPFPSRTRQLSPPEPMVLGTCPWKSSVTDICRRAKRSKKSFLVAMSEGVHPFPSRTRQLSPPEPMVLGTSVPGRVGRRQRNFKKVHGVITMTFCLVGDIPQLKRNT